MQVLDGNLKKCYLPDGGWVVIREQNGADDDIMSNPVKNADGTAFCEFIAGIIKESSYGPTLTVKDVQSMPINVKYAILINSRIHSHGPILRFQMDWDNDGTMVEIEENLEEVFLLPYEDMAKAKELLSEKPFAIPPYPTKDVLHTFTLTSGKSVRFKVVDTFGEMAVGLLPATKKTKNTELQYGRNLELSVDGKYEKVENFALFSVSDMKEIRKYVKEVDPFWNGDAVIDDPDLGSRMYNLLSQPDFFYPEDI